MKIEKIKDLAYYESLPYTIVVRKDEDGEFVARIQELNGCIAHGETEASAIQNLRSMQRLWIEDALSAEDDIPEPEEEASLPSGKWLQRVPRRLHRDLVNMAKRDNISLNQLVTSMLSEAFATRSCADTFQVILSRASYPVDAGHLSGMYWGSAEHMLTEDPWVTSPFIVGGGLAESLTRVKNLNSKSTLLPWYTEADQHPEHADQLATK
jgi:antitoxin HicB